MLINNKVRIDLIIYTSIKLYRNLLAFPPEICYTHVITNAKFIIKKPIDVY